MRLNAETKNDILIFIIGLSVLATYIVLPDVLREHGFEGMMTLYLVIGALFFNGFIYSGMQLVLFSKPTFVIASNEIDNIINDYIKTRDFSEKLLDIGSDGMNFKFHFYEQFVLTLEDDKFKVAFTSYIDFDMKNKDDFEIVVDTLKYKIYNTFAAEWGD